MFVNYIIDNILNTVHTIYCLVVVRKKLLFPAEG